MKALVGLSRDTIARTELEAPRDLGHDDLQHVPRKPVLLDDHRVERHVDEHRRAPRVGEVGVFVRMRQHDAVPDDPVRTALPEEPSIRPGLRLPASADRPLRHEGRPAGDP